jgi:hypothetical protein
MEPTTLDFSKDQAIGLMQALLGVITPNYRMIWISKEPDDLLLVHIVLERSDDVDFEEIDDLEVEFEALQLTPINFRFEIIVTRAELQWPSLQTSIVVYRRKEY